ncbi:MAG: outer membrane protein assembly factor, partial [Hymenobacteraceae bacterium]|nr:outer membrane protein assembly factor [Hymenobacteraceae bacterium]MDX5396943.1 outer membrane protein assembly factor [Hymenobacteraceae bacterium]MDX5513017.1 outer membrane protein assembly factor [Hymenobacteraceae bacterium]
YTQHAYTIPDTAVLQLVKQNAAKSLVQVGARYNEEDLAKERDRLENLLRNNGYFQFRKQYISFEVDTSFQDYTVRLHTVIENPTDSTNHEVFRIRKVNFYTDAGASRFGIYRDTILFNNVYYLSYDHKYKPKVLDTKIDVYPGQRYRQFRTNSTQKQLSDLDVFRFSTVSYNIVDEASTPDSATTKLLDAVISVTPAQKLQYTTEIGVNLTERLPGPFGRLTIRVRNVFNGADVLDISFRGGLEGQFSTSEDKAVYKQELGTNLALTFPRIMLPFVRRDFLSDYSPRTRINTGYTYINRPEYIRTNAEVSLDYLWQKQQKVQHIFSPIDIDIIDTAEVDPTFRKYLETIGSSGNTFIKSFTKAFVSSINYNLIYNTNNFIQTRDSRYLRTFVELGGLSNYIGLDYGKLIDEELETFRFGKINIDYRRYNKFSENNYFVYRANVGYAQPFESDGLLPYDKYFFAGGGSSIRAWRPRKLGPGSFTPPFKVVDGEQTDEFDYSFEQPGEILLETNFEYRFKMFSFIKGALFVDAGNVWTLKEDPQRPGGQFQFNNFYKELAVATGLGFRFDFSFVILRVDVATKAVDPARPEGERFVLDRFSLGNIFNNEQTVINLGIGYPF